MLGRWHNLTDHEESLGPWAPSAFAAPTAGRYMPMLLPGMDQSFRHNCERASQLLMVPMRECMMEHLC